MNGCFLLLWVDIFRGVLVGDLVQWRRISGLGDFRHFSFAPWSLGDYE